MKICYNCRSLYRNLREVSQKFKKLHFSFQFSYNFSEFLKFKNLKYISLTDFLAIEEDNIRTFSNSAIFDIPVIFIIFELSSKISTIYSKNHLPMKKSRSAYPMRLQKLQGQRLLVTFTALR